MTGRSSRAKGQRGEREFAALCADWLGDRSIARELGQERDGGCDVRLEALKVAIQVKRQESSRFPEWLKQATEDAGSDTPAVAWRRNGGRWVVAMDALDWLALVREAM